MSEPIKSAYPVQTRIITPINDGSVYTAKTYIQFKINASQLPMCYNHYPRGTLHMF